MVCPGRNRGGRGGRGGRGRREVGCQPFRPIVPNEEDENPLELVIPAGTRKKNEWATSKFYAWREAQGPEFSLQDLRLIEELPAKELSHQLALFYKHVLRDDGKPYPPATLRDMFFCFNRVLKLAREARVARTGVLEEEVDILNDPRFLTARNAASNVIRKAALETTRPASTGSKHVYLSMAELKAVLTLPEFLPNSPNGLFRLVVLFCMNFFLVCGRKELYDLRFTDFTLLEDVVGCYIQFNQRVSKNYQVDLMNCKSMDRQPAVDLYEIAAPSVYKAFKFFFDKHPAVGDGEDLNKRPFFLACNDCFNRTDNWYRRGARIGEHKISEVVKLVAAKTGLSLSAKDIRHSAITTMSVCNTPIEDCMKLTGHKRVENMEQYDHSGKARRMAMSSVLYNRYDRTGHLKNYQDEFRKASEYIVRCYEVGKPLNEDPLDLQDCHLVSFGGNDNQQTQIREQQQQHFGGPGQQQPSPREEIDEQELNHHQVLDVIEEQQGGHDKQHETVPEPVPEHGEQQELVIFGDKNLDDNELLLALAKDPRAAKALVLPTSTTTFHHCSVSNCVIVVNGHSQSELELFKLALMKK